jgi:hypothetical protein
MRNKLLSLVFSFFSFTLVAQELNCRVIVNAEQIQTQERSVFREMEIAFSEFMNNQKWTDHEFKVEERINCNIIITLDPEQSNPGLGNFGASVQILSSRPVYNSNYESIVFNFADRDWLFEYVTSQPLQFNENSFTNNLSALLGFYAYVIIGFDFDTFSELGGDEYFRRAANIVTTAQQSGYPGWEQFNSIRNRYWLSENLLNNQMSPIRQALYEYHINGLDIIQEQPAEARVNISNCLKKVLNVNQARPRAILTISFLDAKSNELAQIFSEGDPALRRNVFNLLVNLDPTKREMFQPLLK